MHASRSLTFTLCGCCLFFLALLSGCVKHVNLPQAPPFPSTSQSFTSEKQEQRAIRALIDKAAASLWSSLEQHWGVQKLMGRFSVRVHVSKGELVRCEWRRSELTAIYNPSSQSRSGDTRSRRRPTIDPCALLRKRKWGSVRSRNVVVVEHLVTRGVNSIAHRKASNIQARQGAAGGSMAR